MGLEGWQAVFGKLADQALVFADARGFAEMALPGDAPGGLLRYLARLLMVTGRSFWGSLLYFALGGLLVWILQKWLRTIVRRRDVALVVSCALVGGVLVLPVMAVAEDVWSQTESAFPMMNVLGLLFAAAFVAAARPLIRFAWGVPTMAVCACALFVPFGGYALLAGAVLACRALFGAAGDFWRRLWAGAMLTLLAVAVPLVGRLVYADLNPRRALAASFGLPTSGRWPRGVMLEQLAVERRAFREDWSGIRAAAAASESYPLRMTIAYRILASFKAGQVLEELFQSPIRTSHRDTSALETLMDGHQLLFEYGCLLPARKEIMEQVARWGWRPGSLRYLGDIAFLRGELMLAYRFYSQLKRVPGWREWAARRLAALEKGDRLPDDLVPVAQLAVEWRRVSRDWSDPFFLIDATKVEDFIYERFRGLSRTTPEMARMYLAAKLLTGDTAAFAAEKAMLAALYPPPKAWPVAVQEAFATEALRREEPARAAFLAGLPQGALQAENIRRAQDFAARRARLGSKPSVSDAEELGSRFGTSYMYYEFWALGK